jgi:predicted Zn finger-like uncharacterized protein
MIIECEECKSKFNIDEGLLRDEGSKVRCSLCKHVFEVYPPGLGPQGEEVLPEVEDLEKTSTMEAKLQLEDNVVVERLKDLGHEDHEEVKTQSLESALDRTPRQGIGKVVVEKGLGRVSRVERAAVPEKMQAEIPRRPEKARKPSKAKKAGRSPVLPIILIVILLLLGGSTAIYLFAPQYIPGYVAEALPFLKGAAKIDTKDPGFRRLSFKAITGAFVQSNNAGMLFVIRGMVVNNYSNSRSFILIKGSLLDDKGKVVKTKLAYAANLFAENEVKELPLDQINQALRNRSGKGNTNVNVKPQDAIPFMVIFEELPDNLSEFTVEAVSSSPGQ